jgi:hypothetical protein
MKRKKRISQLTLELYYRGLATYKERKQVEKALKTDSDVQSRYKFIQESEREIQQILSQEFLRLNIQETPTVPPPQPKMPLWGIIAMAAILLCALIPTFLYLKNSNSNKDNAIAEGTTKEIDTTEENYIDDDDSLEGFTPASYDPEEYNPKDNTKSTEKNRPENNKKPETQQQGLASETNKQNTDLQQGGVSVAEAPQPDTGIHTRGGNEEQQSVTTKPSEQESNLNIPPGITFIFENMFANKQLSVIVIPSRITSIGKNAFAGNPLVSVTIGANVNVDGEAIPGNFAKAYNSYGKAAGTYIRPNINSEAWEKK